ncbi:MAG: glycosyltransferase family 4 protein [Acidobacteriota bacterium]
MHTAVFTIVSPNYRHFARVLMDSLSGQHPDWEQFVLIVGGDADAHRQGERFTTVPLDALRLPHPRQFAFRYTILELNTAVKPWMFEHLFDRGFERVVYFDPDIFVYSPLVELDAVPAGTFMVLTPHLTGSIPGDGHPSERAILQAGTYNLGFLTLSRGPALGRFLAWWQEKLELRCVVDIAQGLFVDQKWMDLTPGLFSGVTILRHDGYNVAYWNLRQRQVVKADAGIRVKGLDEADEPLRFFHFSGVDPVQPELVSKYDVLTLDAVGDARALIQDYVIALGSAGYESFKKAPYAFATFADGSRLPNAARLAYRTKPALQAAGGEDPFAHPELFRGMRDRSRAPLTARVALQSYRVLSRVRPVVRLLPQPLRQAMREFLLGRKESPARKLGETSALAPGLNIAGYVSRDTGVGESARLCAEACAAVGIENRFIDVDERPALPQEASYRATVYHVNADQTPAVHQQLASLFDASAYNIGCWHWELPELPDAWTASATPLDEIWAPSSFVQSAVSRKVTIPVVHMPHGIAVTAIEPCFPTELGAPAGRFTFLCMFDLDSVGQRKNPLGAVEAFRRAFPSGSEASLLIKAGRAEQHPREYAELEQHVRDIPGIYLTQRMLTRARVNGLLASCDAVVSMHRSEGFGLILAEAMSLGKPVVATGWSGNMDFMNPANSCPVGYELITLDRTYGAYAAGQQWADPDLDHAAHLMSRLVDDDAWRARLGRNAQETMRTQFSPRAAGLRYRHRLRFLGLMER